MTHIMFEEPMFFMYRGRKILVENYFGKMLISRRKDGIQDLKMNPLVYTPKPMRKGYFTLERPTVLKPGGELEPAEFDYHLHPEIFKKEFPGVPYNEYPYVNWRPSNGEEIKNPEGFLDHEIAMTEESFGTI